MTAAGTAALLLALAAAAATPPPSGYVQEIEHWRAERDARLRGEDGWLTLVGLVWLAPGENVFGSDKEAAIPLPAGSAPARAGSLVYDGKQVRLVAAPGVTVTLEGQPVTERVLADDSQGKPDVIKVGRVSLQVLSRGERHAVRVKDPESPVRKDFKGVNSFPVDPRWRVEATFKPLPAPREILVPTVAGSPQKMLVPGLLEFELGGKACTLEPLVESLEDEQFFLIFRDQTSGKETYGSGRYLYVKRQSTGPIVIDFNLAYNPPCVFTPHATCPLPPKANLLPVRVVAGEKVYAGH